MLFVKLKPNIFVQSEKTYALDLRISLPLNKILLKPKNFLLSKKSYIIII